MLTARKSVLLCVLTMGLAACGDDSAPGGSGGGGTPPQGGESSGGQPPEGAGNPGGAPQGGSGGNGGAPSGGGPEGGSGGQAEGGAPGAEAECAEDADCALSSDCCECAGRPVGEAPPACAIDCLIPQCTSLGAGQPNPPAASCQAGRCVTNLSCDAGPVNCFLKPPVCPPGSSPIVANACWTGQCMPVLECSAVTDCDSCTGAGVGCATYSAFVETAHCVDLQGCPPDDCACLGGSVCIDPFNACNEIDGSISCGCPTCLF
jgi:hypothetical protein